jgi:hypothetical protein
MVFGIEMIILTLPTLLTLNEMGIEDLFAIFKKDFIDNKTHLSKGTQKYLINVKKDNCCPCPFGNSSKPERFWHIITKDEYNRRARNNPCLDAKEKNRKYDVARAKRIHWIKIIIDSWQTDENIKHFYQRRGNKVSLILWHSEKDFLIIIRKESNSSDRFLISSYLIFRSEIRRYEKQLKEYEENSPTGDEWF